MQHGSPLTVAVSPIPFQNQQLPYTPKFVPPELEGLGPEGMVGFPAGSVARGPASAAASAIIPPTPGGVAGESTPDCGSTVSQDNNCKPERIANSESLSRLHCCVPFH